MTPTQPQADPANPEGGEAELARVLYEDGSLPKGTATAIAGVVLAAGYRRATPPPAPAPKAIPENPFLYFSGETRDAAIVPWSPPAPLGSEEIAKLIRAYVYGQYWTDTGTKLAPATVGSEKAADAIIAALKEASRPTDAAKPAGFRPVGIGGAPLTDAGIEAARSDSLWGKSAASVNGAELEVENARLREALTQIINVSGPGNVRAYRRAEIAEAALRAAGGARNGMSFVRHARLYKGRTFICRRLKV